MGIEGLKEKDCGDGAGVSNAVNLSARFSFTVGGEAAAILWGVGVGSGDATAAGLMGGAKEKAEGAEGVSEGGLAKEKLEGPGPKGAVVATEKAGGAEEAQVVGTEKAKLDDDAEDTGGAGATLNGAAEGAAAGARRAGAAAGGKPRFGNVAGADGMEAEGMEAATLGGWAAKAPGMGGLSPSRARTDGGATSCLTPGLRLSRANGQSIPSVDSISMVGAGGKVFSSVM